MVSGDTGEAVYWSMVIVVPVADSTQIWDDVHGTLLGCEVVV
jgi:hypothetical protein